MSSFTGRFLGARGGGTVLPKSLVFLFGQAKGLLSDTIAWVDGAVLVVQFAPTAASGDVVGDIQVLGPLYMRAGYLVANDGVSDPPALLATSWAADEMITAIVETNEYGLMRVGRRD